MMDMKSGIGRNFHSPLLVRSLLVWILIFAGTAVAGESKSLWLLHLPGIAGARGIDQALVSGLSAGGLKGEFEIYDWPAGNNGLVALQNEDHHLEAAQSVADILTKQFRANPRVPIYITAHSAGSGIAVWALERLPDDVKIECLVMLAPALSPEYDLSKALKHITKKTYVFASEFDYVVLGTGTKVFGTVDGVNCEAAGLNGFVQPKESDAEEYRKLCPQPYNVAWGLQYGNVGSHISCMKPKFAREYIAVLLRTGSPPILSKSPTTQPIRASAQPTTKPVAIKTTR